MPATAAETILDEALQTIPRLAALARAHRDCSDEIGRIRRAIDRLPRPQGPTPDEVNRLVDQVVDGTPPGDALEALTPDGGPDTRAQLLARLHTLQLALDEIDRRHDVDPLTTSEANTALECLSAELPGILERARAVPGTLPPRSPIVPNPREAALRAALAQATDDHRDLRRAQKAICRRTDAVPYGQTDRIVQRSGILRTTRRGDPRPDETYDWMAWAVDNADRLWCPTISDLLARDAEVRRGEAEAA